MFFRILSLLFFLSLSFAQNNTKLPVFCVIFRNDVFGTSFEKEFSNNFVKSVHNSKDFKTIKEPNNHFYWFLSINPSEININNTALLIISFVIIDVSFDLDSNKMVENFLHHEVITINKHSIQAASDHIINKIKKQIYNIESMKRLESLYEDNPDLEK